MFSITYIEAAKRNLKPGVKVYLTSDNCLYVVESGGSISHIEDHCLENKISLMDVENDQILELGTPTNKKKK